MKLRLLCTLLLQSICLTLYAQEKTSFGLQAGINRATITGANKGVTQFSGGLVAAFAFNNKVEFQTGIFYQGKGWADEYGSYKNKVRINYVQVPLYVNYRFKLKPGHIYIGAGPYVAVALSGRYQYNAPIYYAIDYYPTITSIYPYQLNNYSSKLVIGKKERYQDVADYSTRRMDYGLTSHAGFMLNNGLFINAGYDLGIANIAYQPVTRRLRTASFSVGYLF